MSSSSALSSCWPETASGQLELDGDRLPHRPRPQRLIAAPRQPQRAQPQPPEAIGHRVARQLREPPQRGDPEPLELVGEVITILAEPPAEQRNGKWRQELRRGPDDAGGMHRRHIGAEAAGARTESRGLSKFHPGSLEHALDPSPEAAQAAGLEERLARAPGLDLRADPLQPPQRLFPGALGPLRVRGDQRQLGAARERLPQPHPGPQPESLGRPGDLPDQLRGAGLGGERRRPSHEMRGCATAQPV